MKNKLIAFLAVALLAGPMAAQADYKYTTIDFPGAMHTILFGINSRGQVVGNAYADDTFSPIISFVYDSKKKGFTVLPNVPGSDTTALGINAAGVVVGFARDFTTEETSGTLLDKGAYTIFSHPALASTQARAISNNGLVTGWGEVSGGLGFIYDPATNSFIDILIPNASRIIAQGINSRGQVVGSVRLLAGGAYPGSPSGEYGFLRSKSGATTLFRVNGGQTRARGISNSSHITGYMADPATGRNRGFVVALADSLDFQALTIPDAELLDVPGAGGPVPGNNGTVAQGINNSGYISGSWVDDTGATHGLIAAPH